MCNPALAAGVIAQGAGIMMQQRAANAANRARGGAIAAEGDRQDSYYTEAQGAQDQSRQMFDRQSFDPGMQSEADRIATILNSSQRGRPFAPGVRKGAPQIVADAQAAELESAANYDAQQDQALADLNAFGSYLMNTINPQLSKSAGTTQMVGNFMKGSSGALQGELEAANRKAVSLPAQLLQAGGQVATSYGLAKPK